LREDCADGKCPRMEGRGGNLSEWVDDRTPPDVRHYEGSQPQNRKGALRDEPTVFSQSGKRSERALRRLPPHSRILWAWTQPELVGSTHLNRAIRGWGRDHGCHRRNVAKRVPLERRSEGAFSTSPNKNAYALPIKKVFFLKK